MIGTIKSILDWFGKARPQISSKDFHSQMGVHFEEVSEMLQEITGLTPEISMLLEKAKLATHELAEYLKSHSSEQLVQIDDGRRIAYLDALCDQCVTAIGCAQASVMDIDGGLAEVADSNWSKFDAFGDPIFDPNGKIIKGPNYRKADLSPFV